MRTPNANPAGSRPGTLAAVAVACAVALAACGSSNSSHSIKGPNAAAGLKFSDCMRAHGVTNFPDPGSGGGIQIQAGSGINPQSPAFQSAQNACFKLLPGGGPRHGQASEARKLEMLHLAQCMRRNGVPTFPDPTSSPPAPGNGLGIAFGAPGSFIAVPQALIQSPAFQHAATTCGFPGAGHLGKRSAVGG